MKKVIILLIMCAISLSAFSKGWEYDSGYATLMSSFNDIEGGNLGTILCLIVGKDDYGEKDLAVCVLAGEHENHDFRKGQEYIIVEGYKFDILKRGDVMRIIDTLSLLELLRQYDDTFYISLPVLGVGVVTFYFDPNGYPLDW